MTNGDMGDEKITVMHLISQFALGKRTRQLSRILADYDLEGYLVRSETAPSCSSVLLSSLS